MQTTTLGRRAIYGLIVLLVGHYAYLVPAAMMGFYIKQLIPGPSLWSVSGHVLVMVLVWLVFRGSLKLLTASFLIVCILGFLVNHFLAGWPTVGMPNFVQLWIMTVLQYWVSPLVAYLMLLKADRIAPHIVRSWGSR